jgi:pterin-4a-carbinolamine dehydratase
MSEATLSPTELAAELRRLPRWRQEGGVIRRVYRTGGWRVSMLVANAIGFICEAGDHHADVLVTWPTVTVSLSTHSAGGITMKDIETATLIEHHVTWAPGPESQLSGKALVGRE